MNLDQKIEYAQPKTEAEREAVAGACLLDLELEMPMLLDEISNEVDTAYAALPERLYLIDSEGSIVYRGEPGPFGFRPDEWEQAIRDLTGVEPAR